MLRSVAGSAALAVVALTGCGLFGDDPGFTISAATPNATVQQSGVATILIEISRTNFDKPVSVEVEGTLPAGLTAVFTQNPVPNGTSSVTLNIAATGSTVPGTTSLTIKATGDGVGERTLDIEITVAIRGSHTLSLLGSTVTAAQSGGGSATLLISRSNNNAGSVTLAASSPAGIVVTFSPSSTTGTGAGVFVAVAGSVSPGSYPITITGSQPGLLPDPTTTLTVNVISAPATMNVSLPVCSPTWFAYQNEGFPWRELAATSGRFDFAATTKLAIAFAFVSGSQSVVRMIYGARDEFEAMTDFDCLGTKTLSVSTSNVSAAQTVIVGLGPVREITQDISFALEQVPVRALDLVASRGQLSTGLYTPDRLLVRRGINQPTGSTLPVLDFQAAETFTPAINTLTFTGVAAGENIYVQNDFWASTFTNAPIYAAIGTSSSISVHSVPAAQLVAGDVQRVYMEAFSTTSPVWRAIQLHAAAIADRAENFGSSLAAANVTTVTSTPYARLRFELAGQAEYGTAAQFQVSQPQGSTQPTKILDVIVTAGHLGSAPANWDVVLPDLSGLAGFSSAWVPSGATDFVAGAYSGRAQLLFGATPGVGESFKAAFRAATATAAMARREGARGSLLLCHGMMNRPPR